MLILIIKKDYFNWLEFLFFIMVFIWKVNMVCVIYDFIKYLFYKVSFLFNINIVKLLLLLKYKYIFVRYVMYF